MQATNGGLFCDLTRKGKQIMVARLARGSRTGVERAGTTAGTGVGTYRHARAQRHQRGGGSEIETLSFARLYRGSPGMATDRSGDLDRRGCRSPGSGLAAGHCICDKRFLLPPDKPRDGWTRRVDTFAPWIMPLVPIIGGLIVGTHCALWVGQDSRPRNSRGDRGDPAAGCPG
jgi:hypothetical protein